MSHQRTGPRSSSRPKHQRASQGSGLIATGKSVRHSAKPKAALDDRSHRTIALIERLKLSCERLTRRARDADITIPDAGEKPDASSARQLQRTLADQCIVLRVRADPEPEYPVFHVDAERSMVQADADRPEPPDALQSQRGVIGIRLQELVRPVREPLDGLGERLVGAPEPRRGVMWHARLQRARPAAAMLGEGLVGERIQLARRDVRLELLVPAGGVKVGEPAAELRELRSREGGDFALDLLDLGHRPNIAGGPVVCERLELNCERPIRRAPRCWLQDT